MDKSRQQWSVFRCGEVESLHISWQCNVEASSIGFDEETRKGGDAPGLSLN